MIKWLSPSNKIYYQLPGHKKLALAHFLQMVILDSEHQAKELGWKKIGLKKKKRPIRIYVHQQKGIYLE